MYIFYNTKKRNMKKFEFEFITLIVAFCLVPFGIYLYYLQYGNSNDSGLSSGKYIGVNVAT